MYILLFIFWLLLNGKLTTEIILLGLVIVIIVAAVENRLFGYTLHRELRLLRKIPLLFAYILVLFWEMLKASCVVSRDILFRRYTLTPALITFRTDLQTDLGRFLLANSITLTPGTITIRMEGDLLTVHCLDKSMLDISENGVFQRWIRRMEA